MPAKKIGYADYRTAHLKKITKAAKALRNKKPSLKWTDAVKQASAAIKAGKKVSGASVAKKPAAKKTAVKTAVKGGTNARTIRANESIDQLKKYGQLCMEEKVQLDGIKILGEQYKALPVSKEKQNVKRLILMYKKHLTAIRKQKAIQKTLI